MMFTARCSSEGGRTGLRRPGVSVQAGLCLAVRNCKNPGVKESNQGRNGKRWLLPAALVGALVVGGVAGGAIINAAKSSASPTAVSAGSSSQVSACNVTAVADKVTPSVVTIAVQGKSAAGTGSGEVIRSDGYILTNNHVIAPAAAGGSVQVQFADGQTAAATITGRDPQTDLAVLKVDTSRQLPVIPIGSSASVQVGEAAVVIGAPLGLSGTVTSGIISALDRTIQVPADNDSAALLVGAIQTDAAINPGNSGGSMVNCSGQLIGIPSAGATVPSSSGESAGGSIGLGFAIPVDEAVTIANEIITTGTVTHAYLGVAVAPVPPGAAAQGGVPSGLYVQTVTAGGPAAAAGLRTGDVITKINGQPAASPVQLQELTLSKKAGDTVDLEVWRSGQTASVTVTLGTQP
jgi:putative serine protease PepD